VVAVVSDGSAFTEPASVLGVVLRHYATLIRDATGLPTQVIRIEASDPGRFAATFTHALTTPPAQVAAVFLTHTDPDRARAVQHVAGGLVVLIDEDTTAIALTAAVCTALARAARPAAAARVVIAGGARIRMLGPLLVAAGIGELTAWWPQDAPAYPLPTIAAQADVVINLLGRCPAIDAIRAHYPDLVVIAPDPTRDPLLVVPGLLRAATAVPDLRLNTAVAHAAALALVMATPPLQELPPGPYPALAEQVADAVIWSLPAALRHPSGRAPHKPTPDTRPGPT
jgi:malate dehydrogenase (oxaloacetate-decarboxylating)